MTANNNGQGHDERALEDLIAGGLSNREVEEELRGFSMEEQIALTDKIYESQEHEIEKKKGALRSIVRHSDYVDVQYRAARARAALLEGTQAVSSGAQRLSPVRKRERGGDLPGFVQEYIADVEALARGRGG